MFDLSGVKAQGDETLPAGKYVCNITNAELKDTKAGNGKYVKVEFTVKEGESSGRKVWAQINVANANPKAEEIGKSQLKSLLICAAYPNPDKLDSVTSLCGLTVGVKTKIKTDEYGEKAEVSYFYDAKKGLPQTGEPLPF